ncbi:exported hypothetical protein [Nitrospina gracilis 3/211]|uniref:Uncharacterized protein n=1 Tax=Nitrospina gracilis (strain 3/211) TaxID=1266370 RepID=M1YFN3_NITG3|nr:hypothetical protein [Nitrospina gracilis]CCQ89247.1 exported hypothetical protein [Nitrospina gracilis 3/211]
MQPTTFKSIKTSLFALIVSFTFSCLFTNPSFADNPIYPDFVDRKITGIELGTSYLKELKSVYGEGLSVLSDEGVCYFSEKENTFIIFSLCEDNLVCSYDLSKDKDLWGECSNYKTIHSLKTGKGISLGDSIEKVIGIYGWPESSKPINNLNEVKSLDYHTDYTRDRRVTLFMMQAYTLKTAS